MSTYALLTLYSAIIIASTLLGGWLPTRVRMTHTLTQITMSFVAGLMLGIALYHLLPHAVSTLVDHGGVDRAVWWLMVGLLFMFVLLRAFHFHQHGHQEEECQHDHGHGHGEAGHKVRVLSWAGVAIGLTVHTLIDGLALGAAIQVTAISDPVIGLAGFGVFVAIVLHKPLDAMSIASLMVAAESRPGLRRLVNIIFAVMCPLGALLFVSGADSLAIGKEALVGIALAFSAGVFVCISLSDLLPEVQFHSHDRGKLTVALLLGIVLSYGIGLLEPEHSFGHGEEGAHEHHH